MGSFKQNLKKWVISKIPVDQLPNLGPTWKSSSAWVLASPYLQVGPQSGYIFWQNRLATRPPGRPYGCQTGKKAGIWWVSCSFNVVRCPHPLFAPSRKYVRCPPPPRICFYPTPNVNVRLARKLECCAVSPPNCLPHQKVCAVSPPPRIWFFPTTNMDVRLARKLEFYVYLDISMLCGVPT